MTYDPFSLEMITPFSFTVFYPEGMLEAVNGVRLEDGVKLSGTVRVYAHASGRWPGPEVHWSLNQQPDYFQMPRLCVDGLSPLLRWDNFSWSGGMLLFDGRPPYSSRFVYWDVNTRHYSNGPHTLTVASWLWFHIGEGSGTMIEVIFSNPENELIVPRPPVCNPNVPALWFQEQDVLSPKGLAPEVVGELPPWKRWFNW